MSKHKHNVLDSKTKYRLVREVDIYANSPRKLTLTTLEFVDEVSRELGTKVTVSNLESAVGSIDMCLTDIFKQNTSSGRSIFAEMYKLTKRIEDLEKRLEGL